MSARIDDSKRRPERDWEQQLRDLAVDRDTALAASRAKSQFLAQMGHDICTPLRGILGFADLLLLGTDDGCERTRREYLNAIRASGRELLELVEDMNDVSRIEWNQLDVVVQRCSPHLVISEVVSQFRGRAGAKGLELEYDWIGPVPDSVETDPRRLRQLLVYVIGNALTFTERGRIDIATRLLDVDERTMLQIEVRDTGIGIRPDRIDRIFEPFVQGENPSTRRRGGAGIGLALCRSIAERLGGGITVSSEWGRGSTFRICVDAGEPGEVIGLSRPSSDVYERDASIVSRTERTCVSLAGRRILVADDGASNRHLTGLVLRRAGAEIVLAEHGAEALEAARDGSFDAILMDLEMPVLDGLAATRLLRGEGYTGPIVAMTAPFERGEDQRFYAAGCSHYVVKPFESRSLLATMDAALTLADEESGRGPRGITVEEWTEPDLDIDEDWDAVPPFAPAVAATDNVQVSVQNSATSTAAMRPGRSRRESKIVESTRRLDDPGVRRIVAAVVEQLKLRMPDFVAATRDEDFDRLFVLARWAREHAGAAGYGEIADLADELERNAEAHHALFASTTTQRLLEAIDRMAPLAPPES